MSSARHRDDLPWWERDDRTWPDVLEWFLCVVFVPTMIVLAIVVAGVKVTR